MQNTEYAYIRYDSNKSVATDIELINDFDGKHFNLYPQIEFLPSSDSP